VVSHDRAFIDGVATSVLTPEGEGGWLETPGGYRDYEAQSASRPSRARTGRPRGTPEIQTGPETAAAQRPSGRLTYKDQRRLEEINKLLPERIAEAARVELELGQAGLFTTAPARFTALAERLSGLRTEIDRLETEWLELEEKREAARS